METEKKSVSLYDLAAELAVLKQRLIDNGDDDQTIADTLEGEALDFDNKILACAYAKKDLEALCSARKEALREMQQAIERAERQIEWLEKYMLDAMRRVNRPSIAGRHFTVEVMGKNPAVLIENGAMIPRRFYRTAEVKPPVPVPDKKAIADAIRRGEDVPGARLDEGKKLVIR